MKREYEAKIGRIFSKKERFPQEQELKALPEKN